MTNRLYTLLLALALTACGGGGGEPAGPVNPGPAENPPPPPPVSQTVSTDYYRLHIEFVSTSDWATLTPLNPELVRAVRQLALSGPVERHGAVAERLWVVGSEASTSAPQTLVADIAIDKAAASAGLQFLLEKGVANGATIRIYAYSDDTNYSLISETVHTGVVPGHTTNNPLTINLSAAVMAAAPLLSVQAPVLKKKALAFYYPWYQMQDWTLPQFTDNPLELYSTVLQADVGKIVDKAMDVGLTGFISSWWGPQDVSNPRFQTLLNTLENRAFEASIYYETLRGGQPLDNATIISELSYALNTYGQHPKFMRWNGKPVVFVWATGRISTANWKTILGAVKANAGDAYFIGMGCDSADMDVFDGLHDYTVNQASDVAAYEKRCGKKTRNHFLLSDNQQRKIWVATAMPGYDDTGISDRAEHLVVPRNNGEYYRTTLNAAIGSSPDWVVVTSWNEWPENTHIESSVKHGTLYQDISREYFSAWMAD